MSQHDPDCNCRTCRREERELNKAMGTDRSYIRDRTLNRDEQEARQIKKAKERVSQGKRAFDFYS